MIFIIGGLIITISLGAFMGLMFTLGMKDGIGRTIVSTLIAFVIGFGIMGLLALEYKGDAKRWNNGECITCGKALELFDIEHHRNSGNTYYYKCKNGHLIETANYFEK